MDKLNKPRKQDKRRPAKEDRPPKAARTTAPSARDHEIPAISREGRDSKRNPYAGRRNAEAVSKAGREQGSKKAEPGQRPDLTRPAPKEPGAPKAGNPALGVGAIINRRAADRLRSGHLWVYSSDIESIQLPEAASSEAASPALLAVADSRGLLLGTALYSPSSQIALRMVSREAIDEGAWLKLLADRLRRAIDRRKPLMNAETDACRLCFSEADELPGIIVDKYAGLIILQLLAKGLDSAAVRETCVRVLREEFEPVAILERPDPRMRELEGLAAPGFEPLFAADTAKPAGSTQFRLNGLVFQFEANSGQKTGAFLDQRANYAAAQQWAQRLGLDRREGGGRALDVCCYQGGFALHLAQVCGEVTGIDTSQASLEVAERNLEANRSRATAQVDWVRGDAFQILRDWSDAGETFDAIVLDPPAFAKTHRAVEGALRGYKELNLRALQMMRAGGLLVTCSCSHHVGWAQLEAAVASAAVDAGRRVRLLERRGAALDHPVVLNLPETEYLKCLILEVE